MSFPKRRYDRQMSRFSSYPFCKSGQYWRFYYIDTICGGFQKDGKCSQLNCKQRHPKACKFWLTDERRCLRDDSCRYMHKKEEKGLGIKDNNAKSTKIKAKGSVDDQDNPQTQENRSNKCKSNTELDDNPLKEVPASVDMEIVITADDVITPKAVAAKGVEGRN